MTNHFLKLDRLELGLRGKTHSLTSTVSVASGASGYVQVKTGSASCVILDWGVSTLTEPFRVEAIESPTLTNGTVELPSYKLNRQETDSVVTTFYSNPTNISGGTTIFVDTIGEGKHGGGGNGNDHVWVLKKNTSYLWKITNLGNATSSATTTIFFAETMIP